MKSKFKLIFSSLIVILFLSNLLLVTFFPTPYTRARLSMLSPSKGDRYSGRLLLWQTYILAQEWDQAKELSTQLNSVDLAYYQSIYLPANLKKELNQLTVKPDKNIEDYLRLAQLYQNLGDFPSALSVIKKARQIDPIRQDLAAIFWELQSSLL